MTWRSSTCSPRASAAPVSSCSSGVGSSVSRSCAIAVGVAPRHAVAARRRAELARRALGEDRPVLDDRHAVGERLRLVQVVRGEEDGLAQPLQRAHGVPRLAPGRGVEARGRLVEEHELRVADEREREVEPPLLAARQHARAPLGGLGEPGQRDRLVDVARRVVEPGPVRGPPRARSGAGTGRSTAARCRSARAARAGAGPGPCRARRRARRCAPGTPRGSRRWSSCPPRWARAARRPRRAGRRRRCRGPRAGTP